MKIVKRIAAGLGALIAVAIAAVVVKFYVLSPVSRPPQDLHAKTDAETVKRGEYLSRHVFGCNSCHSKVHEDLPGEPEFSDQLGVGRDFGSLPGLPGRLRARNITNDKAAGIGAWTDGEIVRAMREGVSRDGTPLFPMMPYPTYAQTMSDDDALAVVAYLRSLPPSSNDPGRSQISFPVSMFSRAAPKPVTAPLAAAPPPSDVEARGKWLLQACSCNDCHTTYNERHEPLPGKYLAGGNEFPVAGKGSVYIANITSDAETGIGAWSDEEVMKAIRFGVSKKKPNRALYGMPWTAYGGMSDADLKALVTALRKVAPVKNAVKDAQLSL